MGQLGREEQEVVRRCCIHPPPGLSVPLPDACESERSAGTYVRRGV